MNRLVGLGIVESVEGPGEYDSSCEISIARAESVTPGGDSEEGEGETDQNSGED